MKRVKLIATALVLVVLAVLAGRVAAQETNVSERTFLTFSNTVEMPGMTLPGGTYVFKLADTASRNVVQVWDKDEKNMLGHWLFVQAERPQVTGENVVMFRETREGSTPAIQFWYFPGEKIGKEFIYPKDQAQKIASRTGQRVRTEEGVVEGGGIAAVQPEASPQAQANAELSQPDADLSANADVAAQPAEPAADSALQNAPAAAQPTAAGGSLAGNRGVPQPENNANVSPDNEVAANAEVPADDFSRQSNANRAIGTSGQAQGQVARNELPRTASPLAFSGLLGLLSFASAAGIRLFRK